MSTSSSNIPNIVTSYSYGSPALYTCSAIFATSATVFYVTIQSITTGIMYYAFADLSGLLSSLSISLTQLTQISSTANILEHTVFLSSNEVYFSGYLKNIAGTTSWGTIS